VFGVSLFKPALHQLGANGFILNVRNYRRIETGILADLYVETKQFLIIGHVLQCLCINNKITAPYIVLGFLRFIPDKMRPEHGIFFHQLV